MFDTLNALAARGVDQFRVQSFDSSRLVIVGSFDLCYYHNVEVEFTDVAYVASATNFFEPKFRLGTPHERRFLVPVIGDSDDNLYCIDADAGSEPHTFFVVARTAVVTEGNVYHNPRPDLKAGKRIAPWVKRDDSRPTPP
jgi:hypothetical protein